MEYRIKNRLTGETREVEAGNLYWAFKKIEWAKEDCFIQKIASKVNWPEKPIRTLNNSDPGPLFKKGGN